MSRIFAITSSTSAVALNHQGHGKVTFTVTNTGAEAVRVRGRLVPEGTAQADWLRPPQDNERRLETNGTEQFTVDLVVPPQAAAGHYSFRFDAVSVANPDDDYVEGPSVAFDVAVPTEPEGSFPWWILLLMGGLLLVGGIVAYVMLSGPKELGEACADDCATGLVCSPDEVCVGALGYEGCNSDSQCDAELQCLSEGDAPGRCVSGLEGACTADLDCGSGLACQDGRCLGGLDFNPCLGDAQCASGLWCLAGACRIDNTGQECSNDQPCGEGLKCLPAGVQKVCLREKGQACTELWQCASQNCEAGVCVSLPNGTACTSSTQCDSNICDEGRCRAPIRCRTQRNCPEGMSCLLGFCQKPLVLQPALQLQLNRVQAPENRLLHLGIVPPAPAPAPPPPQRREN